MDLSQIVQQAIKHLQAYSESLKKYNSEVFLYKKDEDTWSLGQLYEHLNISSEFFIRQAEGCLREEKGAFEGEKTPVGEQMFALGGFLLIKIKPPEQYKAAVEVVAKGIEEYTTILSAFIERLPKVQAAIEKNPTTYKRRHAMMGMLTATEWIWCLEAHLRHHLRQQAELEAVLNSKM